MERCKRFEASAFLCPSLRRFSRSFATFQLPPHQSLHSCQCCFNNADIGRFEIRIQNVVDKRKIQHDLTVFHASPVSTSGWTRQERIKIFIMEAPRPLACLQKQCWPQQALASAQAEWRGALTSRSFPLSQKFTERRESIRCPRASSCDVASSDGECSLPSHESSTGASTQTTTSSCFLRQAAEHAADRRFVGLVACAVCRRHMLPFRNRLCKKNPPANC